MFFPYHDENPIERTPYVTVGLIVINVAVLTYMVSLADPQHGDLPLRAFIHRHGFIPARLSQLADPQPLRLDLLPQAAFAIPPQVRTIQLDANPIGIVTSMVTCMFLHGGWLHLVSNMWFLWLFGNNIEDRLGHIPFLLFYLLGGIAATLAHSAMTSGPSALEPVVGASGAVAVTLGAYAVFYPLAKVRTLVIIIIFITFVDVPAIVVLGIWFLGQVVSGLQPPRPGMGANVAWWAHIGGFVVGAAVMPLLTRLIEGHPSHWSRRPHDPNPSRDGWG